MMNGGDAAMKTLPHKPLWLTLACTRCEEPVIVLIQAWTDRLSPGVSWTCPHCGGLQELPVVGEVVFAEKAAVAVKRSA
jgi:hypothetical protein